MKTRVLRRGAVAALLLVAATAPAAPAGAQEDPTPDQDTYVALVAADNVEASIRWSQFTFESADEVLIGRDDLFADSLASGALQGPGRPLLLTPSDRLDDRVVEELERLGLGPGFGTGTVHILGGPEAISEDVATDLRLMGLEVVRHEGPTRVETAVAVSELVASDTVIIARAFAADDPTQAFADSLAAGAWAADEGWPILLTHTDNLTPATEGALQAGGFGQAFVVGGEAAVSGSVMDRIDELIPLVRRVSGPTRFDTAIEIAEERGFNSAGDSQFPILVDGHASDAWADGFSAAALVGLADAPIVLGASGDEQLPDVTREFLTGDISGVPRSFGDPDVGLVCGPSAPDGQCDDAAELRGLNNRETTNGTTGPGVDPETGATAGPDLLDVNILDGIPNNGVPNSVRFRFDKPIVEINPFLFSLQGFDSETRQGPSSGAIDSSDQSSAIIQFLDSIDLRNFTIGTAEGAAVGDGAQRSVLRSAPLGGAIPASGGGTTSAPDLVSVTTNPTAQQKTYFFDAPVQNPVANLFGFHTSSGSENRGDSIVGLSGTQDAVVVQFGPGGVGAGTDAVEAGVRDFADDTSAANVAADGDSAVEGQSGGRDNPIGHTGTTTPAPDLTGASQVAGQPGMVDFLFDENVLATGVVPNRFAVHRDDGTRLTPNTCSQNGPSTLRCSIPGLDQNSIANLVKAAVNAAATTAAAAPNEPNTVGSAPLDSAPAPPGRTDGPDLVGVDLNRDVDTNQVTFVFDESVADSPAIAPKPGAFFIFLPDGTVFPGFSVTVDGMNVSVSFGGGVSAASGGGVVSPTGTQPGVADPGPAAQDFQGNDNSPGSVGGGGTAR